MTKTTKMTKLNKNMSARGGSAFGGNFKRDLLLIDLEFSGLDVSRNEIIQIAALLLDKKTLKEKEAFSSYVRPSKWKNRDKESMAVNKISWGQLKTAPNIKEALMDLHRTFKLPLAPSYIKRGKKTVLSVILSYYGGPADMDFLRAAYLLVGLKWQFDYHYFNLWGVFYSYLAVRNQLNNKSKFAGFSLEDLMKKFKIKSQNRHDALEDCRIEAEVLRRVAAQI